MHQRLPLKGRQDHRSVVAEIHPLAVTRDAEARSRILPSSFNTFFAGSGISQTDPMSDIEAS
jgi:hypothetical protein